MITRALSWTPLDWAPYFLRAQAKVDARKNRADALADFRRARFLEPNAFQVPFDRRTFRLRRREPILAITAWREALQRAGARRLEVYGDMFFHSPTNTSFLAELTAIGSPDPDLILAALIASPRDRSPRSSGEAPRTGSGLRSFRVKQGQV